MGKQKESHYKDFIFDSLNKNGRMMKVATWCIALFEIFFIVRGMITFSGKFTQK